jgi:hypothetical protein
MRLVMYACHNHGQMSVAESNIKTNLRTVCVFNFLYGKFA